MMMSLGKVFIRIYLDCEVVARMGGVAFPYSCDLIESLIREEAALLIGCKL